MATITDLSCLDTVSASDVGTEVELRHPVTNAGLDVFITLLGRDAQVVRDYNRDKANEYLRKQAMAKKRGKDEEVQTMEKFEVSQVELLSVCTIGWRWQGRVGVFPLQKSGKPIEELSFNLANVKRLYTELPEARKQADEAIADLANFIKA